MRRNRLIIAAIVLLTGLMDARAQVDIDSSVSDPALRAYFDVICAAYKTTRKELLIIKQDQIRDDQLPVILHIARRANIPPREIVALRQRGQDYLVVAGRYKLGVDIFRYSSGAVTGKPYEDAYAHLDPPDRNSRLTDDDIVNLVNLRLLVEHYHSPPDVVMKARATGDNFIQINQRLATETKPKP